MGKEKSSGDHSADREDARPRSDGKSTADELGEAESKLRELKEEADNRANQQTELSLDGYGTLSDDGDGDHRDVQELEEAHSDFYGAYQNIVRKHVPKCKLRDKIWEMGKLYLKEGQTSGADCRQARPSQREDVRNEVVDWVMEDKGRAPSDLFNRLYQLNKAAGYNPERVL